MALRTAFLLILLVAAPAFAAPPESDIAVSVQRRGSVIVIDVDLPLDVPPEEAWQTVTDYEHMAQFIPKLVESRVLSRDGNRLRIRQKGRTSRGWLHFSFENVRDVVLVPPTEIRTRLVSGTLRRADSLTKLVPTSTGCRLQNHGEYVVAPWLPVGLAIGYVADETREQFALLRAEIMRRKARVASFSP